MRLQRVLKKSLEGLILIASVASMNNDGKETFYQEKSPTCTGYGQAEVYPSKIQWIDGKPVIERNKYQIGENILGLCWTYSGVIEILEGLKGRDREKVLEHELQGHRKNPWSEEETRRRTHTENIRVNPGVSYIG